MSFLFKIDNKVVYPNPETLMLHPFCDIWERDESPNKEVALQEFAYIEFMTSHLKSNPYREYTEDRKEATIRNEVIKELNWQPDELVEKGMAKIVELQTEGSITYQYWLSNKIAIEKMIVFFTNFDIDERNPKTFSPIYKPRDITSAVADAEKTLVTLNSLKVKVDEEIFDSNKTRSEKVISPFANPNSLKRK